MAKNAHLEIQIDRDVRIPMRDGILLSADIYRPKQLGRYPAIVVRTPYIKTSKPIFENGMEEPCLIEPGKVYKYEIDCWNTSHVFKKGHRIRVEVTSSAFPKYDRNLNTGRALGVSSEMIVAQQSIYHDASYPSAIILPVIPR